MPFGISIAPFVCQKMINAIANWLRTKVQFVWAHMDDLIMADESRLKLKMTLKELKRRCDRVGWLFNKEKTSLEPSKKVTFLGASWGPKHVTRLKSVTSKWF